MAGDDNFGCCGLVQDSAALLRFSWFLRGLHLAKKPGDLCSSSSLGGGTGSALRELRFDYQEEDLSPVARSSPAVAGDLCSSSSQDGRTGLRELRFDFQEEDLSPVARSSPAVAGDLCSNSSQGGRTGTGSALRELRFDYQEEDLSPVARSSPAVAGDLCSSSSQGGRTGSARDVVEISSDEEDPPPMARDRRFDDQEEDLFPVVWNSPAVAPPQREGMAGSVEDDDDCVILDSDPDSTVAVKDEKGSSGDGDSDELQIVAEKGKVACRDYPHSRHLCSSMPFGTTTHEKHCTMCYCFVCDSPAPCSYWGKGLSVDDHCHATDKEDKWKTLRQAFKLKNLPAMRSLDRLSPGSQIPLQNVVTQNQHTHTSVRVSSNAGSTVSAPREESGTSIARTAQVTDLVEPTMSAPRPHPAAVARSGTSNAHTAQITHHVAPAVSAPTACPATRVGSRTSNAQTAQMTVGAPWPRPAAGAGRGTGNAYTSQITHPAEPTVSAGRAYPAGRTGTSISNATRPVEHTASEPRLYPAARAGRDTRNAHSAQNTYPTTANGYLPEPDAPEGATVYVRNLPYHIDNERLKLSFQQAGVVLFSKVIYDRETGQSRGFGFVTMSTVQEAKRAVRIYHGAEVYGRPLTVNMAAPRGGARLDTTRRQSCSSLRIFVCNLPRQVDHSRLEELFSKHGQVVNARVVYERRGETWCSRGFGFVTMATEEESYNAIYSLNKQIIEGHALVVKVARERPEHPLQNVVSQNQHTHTSVRASLNVAPTGSAPKTYPATRARSGTSNAHTAQAIHPVEPTVRAPRSREYRMLPPPA